MQLNNFQSPDVAIFWDYENCHAVSNISGYETASGIRNVAHRFGSVKSFKAYMELPETDTLQSLSLRSELQSSGISLTDCPHNGRKNVADHMIIVDMMAYAMDHPAPATLILISGNRDFAYAVSTLRLRRYHIVVISLPVPGAHISLKKQASLCLDWNADVMGCPVPASRSEVAESTPEATRSPSTAGQSPIPRRASYFGDCDDSIHGFRGGEPTVKPLPASNESAPNLFPSTSGSGNRARVEESSPLYCSPAAQERPEVACVAAPAYSPNVAPTQTEQDFVPGVAVNPTPVMHVANSSPSRCSTSVGDPCQAPLTSPPASFSDDLVTAHIRRSMETTVDDKPLLSHALPRGPSAHAEIHSPPPLLVPSDISVPLTSGDPISAAGPSPEPSTTADTHSVAPLHVQLDNPVPPTNSTPISATGQPRKSPPPAFKSLVECLEKCRAKGIVRPLRSNIAVQLLQQDKMTYKNAGVTKFAQFSALAVKAKVIELGGTSAEAWISLHSDWCS